MHMDIEELLTRYGSERDQLADAMSSSDLYTRQYGTELARWEVQLLRQFKEKETHSIYRYRGFVHHTRDTMIALLTPSPWLMEGEFIHFQEAEKVPPDGAYIEVIGRRIAIPQPLQD
ncbi:MAG: hypothetical protein ACFFFK_10095, partial [Candidatus Thorarchaeota archaeon]